MRRNAGELEKMRRAGKVVAEMHEKTRAAIRPGITTMDLNKVAAEVIERRGAVSNFLGYHGFPKSCCTSGLPWHCLYSEYIYGQQPQPT